jgi:hypothetical protein
MKEKFLKDLPILLNGFAVGMLFWKPNIQLFDTTMYILAMATFFWYGKQMKK